MSKTELAQKYNITAKTLKRWCNNAGIKTGNKKILSPTDVQKIYKRFGEPTQ